MNQEKEGVNISECCNSLHTPSAEGVRGPSLVPANGISPSPLFDLASIAASVHQANAGVNITEESSNSPETPSTEGLSAPLPTPTAGVSLPLNDTTRNNRKRKGRGKARLENIAKGEEGPLPITFNERGQPIGEFAAKFTSCLGILVRDLVPVTLDKWKDLSEDIKEQLWASIQQIFIVDDWNKKVTFRIMGRIWGSHKSKFSKEIFDQGETAASLLKPDNVKSMEDWQQFIKKRCSKEFKEKSKKFKEMRSKQKMLHTTSRKGYARLEDDMRRESKTPGAISRVDVWIRGHLRKDGQPLNEAVKDTVKKMQEYMQTGTHQNTNSLRNDVVTKVLGPEHRGRVRGLGFGAIPSKIDVHEQQRGQVQKSDAKFQAMTQRVDDLQAVINQLTTRLDTNASGLSNATPSVQPTENIEGSQCKLLNWCGTGVIAVGEIESTDPSACVQDVPIGLDCWKVWVNVASTPGVPLYRPTRNFFSIEDAIGNTIAWPSKFIKID
ncbi:uncharacterized protein LOC132302665 isoform X2 [Cornus florida]|nr:uncharacterized protein LOC132302665 isoform X2 [Cornus florida]